MVRRILVAAGIVAAGAFLIGSGRAVAQIVAPSTWAANIVIDPSTNPPASTTFDDWDAIPLAVTDPLDNPSALNLIDIKDIKVANDEDLLYIYASGHRMRTNGLYIAIDTDQDISTGFNIFGLSLVGSEIGYVNDFVFDQREPGVFNSNKTSGEPDPGGSCCTGGPLDLNNGGALMNPAWDVESEEREWGIPLDAVWSANEPFDPTIPNPTFNFILWTDQGLSDVTDVITYTLAPPPEGKPGDFDHDDDVDGNDYLVWQRDVDGVDDVAELQEWRTNFGTLPGAAGAGAAIPEPATLASALVALVAVAVWRRVPHAALQSERGSA